MTDLATPRWFSGNGRVIESIDHRPLLELTEKVTVHLTSYQFADESESFLTWLDPSGVDIFDTNQYSLITDTFQKLGFGEIERIMTSSSNTLVIGPNRITKIYRRLSGKREANVLRLTETSAVTPNLVAVLAKENYCLAIQTQRITGLDAWETGLRSELPWQEIGSALAELHQLLATSSHTSGTVSGAEIAQLGRGKLATASQLLPSVSLEPLDRYFAEIEDETYKAQLIHGDLHLGQLLMAKPKPVFIDFEGIPGTGLANHQIIEYDLASLIRSIDYLVQKCFRHHSLESATKSLISGYGHRQDTKLLHAMIVDRLLHELIYEIRTRPDWAKIPIKSLNCLLAEEEPWHSILQVD